MRDLVEKSRRAANGTGGGLWDRLGGRCPTCGRPKENGAPRGRSYTTGPFDTREELREAVLELHADGITGREIAAILGVSEGTVSRIKNGDESQYREGARVGDMEQEVRASIDALNRRRPA